MARIRTIKPEFFTHEGLYEAEQDTGLPLRLAYSGLWCQCDREGRFKWRPRELKLGILPYDDVDFSRVLDALLTRGYLVKYTFGTDVFGTIPTFSDHQFINNREVASTIPSPPKPSGNSPNDLPTREPRVNDASTTREGRALRGREGKGKECEGKEHTHTPEVNLAPAPAREAKPGVAEPQMPAPDLSGVRVMPSRRARFSTPEEKFLVDLVLLGSPPGIVAGLTSGMITPAHRTLVIEAAKREVGEHGISDGEALEGLRFAVESQVSATATDQLRYLGDFEKYFTKSKYRMDPIHTQEKSNGESKHMANFRQAAEYLEIGHTEGSDQNEHTPLRKRLR